MNTAQTEVDGNVSDLLIGVVAQVSSAWRFRWFGLVAALLTCIAGWIAVGLQADIYEATAKVYVDTSSELRKILGEQIIASGVEDQLEFVRESILGSVELEEVARISGLISESSSKDETATAVQQLREHISISDNSEVERRRLPRAQAGKGATYTISYQYQDRDVAEHVVGVLLNKLVEISLGGQLSRTSDANSFLENQILEYERRLNDAEDSLARFNRENHDKLPNMQGGYFARLQQETSDLDGAMQELDLAKSRHARIEAQISGEVPSVVSEIDPNSIEGRILENERRMDELLLRFTDGHPDVVGTREILNQLRERKAVLDTVGVDGRSSVNNPVYQALVISRNETEEEIAALEVDVKSRTQRLQRLRALIDEMPAVEAELAELNRDYQVVKDQYVELLISLERERLSRQVFNAEQIDFRTIDPPSAAANPVAPNRLLGMLMVLVASYSASVVVPIFLARLHPVVSNQPNIIRSRYGLPVIGSVAKLESAEAERVRHRDYFAIAAALAGVGVLFSIMAVFEVLGPGIRSLV